MKRRSFIQCASGLLLCGFNSAYSQSASSSQLKPLVMGIFPRRNPQLTFKLFTPLADYLSQQLKRPVKLETTRDFRTFWNNIQSKRYDIVHYNQYHYIVSNILFGHEVILKNHEYGSDTIAGSISVRKDSHFENLDDLKQRTILFGGGRMAMQSYISPVWLLKQQGLEKGDYVEKFALNPPNAVISTYHRLADAAGSGDTVIRLKVVKESIDVTQMKYLARTHQLAHLPWAVSPALPGTLKLEIQGILQKLRSEPEGHKILDQAYLSSLSAASDHDYDTHRKIIKDVYGKNYGIEMFKS